MRIYRRCGIIYTKEKNIYRNGSNTDMIKIDLMKRKRAFKIAEAISKTEGASSSQGANYLYDQWAQGKLTDEQLKVQIIALYKKG